MNDHSQSVEKRDSGNLNKESAATLQQTAEQEQNTGGHSKSISPFDIIKGDRKMLLNLVGMVTVWTSASFGYYLIAYKLKYIRGDFYLNNVTSQVTEIFANIVSGIVFKYLGLNATIFLSYTLSLAGMLSLTFSSTTE